MANKREEFYLSIKTILDKHQLKDDAKELQSLLSNVDLNFESENFEKAVRKVVEKMSKETLSAIGESFNKAFKILGANPIPIDSLIEKPNIQMWEEMGKVAGKVFTKGLKAAVQSAISQSKVFDVKSMTKEIGEISAANSRLRNKKGDVVKSNVSKFQKGFSYAAPKNEEKLLEAADSVQYEYRVAEHWEDRYIALLKYKKVYDSFVKQGYEMPKSFKSIGDYTYEQIEEALPRIQTSLQNIFNFSHIDKDGVRKQLIGLTEGGAIDINVSPVVIDKLDVYDILDGQKEIKIPVKLDVKVDKDAEKIIHKIMSDDSKNEKFVYLNTKTGRASDYIVGAKENSVSKSEIETLLQSSGGAQNFDSTLHTHPNKIAAPSDVADMSVYINDFERFKKHFILGIEQIAEIDLSSLTLDQVKAINDSYTQKANDVGDDLFDIPMSNFTDLSDNIKQQLFSWMNNELSSQLFSELTKRGISNADVQQIVNSYSEKLGVYFDSIDINNASRDDVMNDFSRLAKESASEFTYPKNIQTFLSSAIGERTFSKLDEISGDKFTEMIQKQLQERFIESIQEHNFDPSKIFKVHDVKNFDFKTFIPKQIDSATIDKQEVSNRRNELVNELAKYKNDDFSESGILLNLKTRKEIFELLQKENLLTDEIEKNYEDTNQKLQTRLELMRQAFAIEDQSDENLNSDDLTKKEELLNSYEQTYAQIQQSGLFDTSEIERFKDTLDSMRMGVAELKATTTADKLDSLYDTASSSNDIAEINDVLRQRKELLNEINADDFNKYSGTSVEEIQKENALFERRVSILQDVKNGLVAIDDVDDIFQETGDLNDKLTALSQVAYNWGSKVKDAEIGDDDEAQASLLEFEETYDRIVLKLKNGKNIEILPNAKGLRALNKYADGMDDSSYGETEIDDVIFERKSKVDNTRLQNIEELKNKIEELQDKTREWITLGKDDEYYDQQIKDVEKLIALQKEYISLGGEVNDDEHFSLEGIILKDDKDLLQNIDNLKKYKIAAQEVNRVKAEFANVDFSSYKDVEDIINHVSIGFQDSESAIKEIKSLIAAQDQLKLLNDESNDISVLNETLAKRKQILETVKQESGIYLGSRNYYYQGNDAIEKKIKLLEEAATEQERLKNLVDNPTGTHGQTLAGASGIDTQTQVAGINADALKGVLTGITYNVKVVADNDNTTDSKVSIDETALKTILDNIVYKVKSVDETDNKPQESVTLNDEQLKTVLNSVIYNVKNVSDNNNLEVNPITIDEQSLNTALQSIVASMKNLSQDDSDTKGDSAPWAKETTLQEVKNILRNGIRVASSTSRGSRTTARTTSDGVQIPGEVVSLVNTLKSTFGIENKNTDDIQNAALDLFKHAQTLSDDKDGTWAIKNQEKLDALISKLMTVIPVDKTTHQDNPFKELIEYIKGKTIYVSDNIYNGLDENTQKFVNSSHRFTRKPKEGALPIDSYWEEWSTQRPDYFNANTINAADQIEELVAYLRASKDWKPTTGYADQTGNEIGKDVINRIANVLENALNTWMGDATNHIKFKPEPSQAKTQKDSRQSEVDKLKKQYTQLGKLEAEVEAKGTQESIAKLNQLQKIIVEKEKSLKLTDDEVASMHELTEESKKANASLFNAKEQDKSAKEAKKIALREAMNSKATSAISRAEGTWLNALSVDNYDMLPDDYKDQIDTYYSYLDKLRKKQLELKNSPVVTDAQKQDLIEQTKLVNHLTDETIELVDNYKRLSGDNAQVSPVSNTLVNGISSTDDYKRKLTEAAQAMHNTKIQVKSFDADSKRLHYTVKTGANEFTEYTTEIRKADNQIVQLRGTTKRTETFLEATKRKMKEISSYLTGMSLVSRFGQELRKGIQYIKEIDSALTELKKVTDETEETYDKFLNTAAKTADKVGSTIKEVVSSTADWARIGYSLEDAAKLAETTSVLLNVSEFQSIDEATKALTSTLQAFSLTADNSMYAVDILNEVGNNFAISSDGIATALQDSASSLVAANNSYEQAVALIASANRVVNLCHEL